MKVNYWSKRSMWKLAGVLLISLSLLSVNPIIAADPPKERLIRELSFIAYAPGAGKEVNETQKFIAEQLKKLGLQIDFKPMLFQGVLQNMFFARNFDLGTLSLTGRPTRVDPQLILGSLYQSQQDVIGGYNWCGYHNKEYDEIFDESSKALDIEKRRALIWKCQEIVTRDVPLITIVHQSMLDAYNKSKWTGCVNMIGNGFKNAWHWTQVKPLTDNKVLVAVYATDSGVLNPLTAHEANQLVCQGVYDTMTKVGPDGSPKPWLAESWTWISPTEIEFKLRRGHKWHDGKPLTAKDVKFTIEYIKTKKIPYHLVACEPIKEVKVIDDYTVRWILNYPFAPLLALTGEQVYILPEHIWKDVPEKTNVDNPIMWSPSAEGKLIGSGFLKFEYWRKNDEIKQVVNKDHFFAPKYDARIIKFIPSAEAALGQLQKGDVDMIIEFVGDPVTLKKVCDSDPKLAMNVEPSVGWYELSMNLRMPPFDDVVLRRAVAAVILRDVIAKNIWKGFATPAYSPTHPMLKPWYNPNVTKWEALGLEGAKKMLREAGYEWDSKGLLYYPAGKKN